MEWGQWRNPVQFGGFVVSGNFEITKGHQKNGLLFLGLPRTNVTKLHHEIKVIASQPTKSALNLWV
eukprot:1746199-Amphidinium_carterae.1